MEVHPSITYTRVLAAVRRYRTSTDNPGFCLNCGEDADNCEPDARNYVCDACGELKVFGAEEVFIAEYYWE